MQSPHSLSKSNLLQDDENPRESKITLSFAVLTTFEFLSIFLMGTVAYFLRFTDYFPIFNDDINCMDQSINYELIPERGTYTVTDEIFYSVLIMVPVGSILLLETFRGLFIPREEKILVGPYDIRLHTPVRRVIRFIAVFTAGLFSTAILIDVLKLLVGRPRPYYATEFCPLEDGSFLNRTYEERIGRLSFPSFHAATSAYSAIFTAFYVHFMLEMRGSYVVRPILVTILIILAFLAGCHRLMTHENRQEDVVVGYLFGLAVAIYQCVINCERFEEREPEIVTVTSSMNMSNNIQSISIPRVNSTTSFSQAVNTGLQVPTIDKRLQPINAYGNNYNSR